MKSPNEKALKSQPTDQPLNHRPLKTPKSPIALLLVEDQPMDALLFRKLLERAQKRDHQFKVVVSKTLREAIELSASKSFDVIVLDLDLPDCSGMETIQRALRDLPATVPIVILTSHNDGELKRRAFQWGVKDYIVKGSFNEDGVVHSLYSALQKGDSQGSVNAGNFKDLSEGSKAQRVNDFLRNNGRRLCFAPATDEEIEKKNDLQRKFWSWRFFMSDGRLHPRYKLNNSESLLGFVDELPRPQQLINLSLGGCSVSTPSEECYSRQMTLSDKTKMFIVDFLFEKMDQEPYWIQIRARHLGKSMAVVNGLSVWVRHFRFIEKDVHRVTPLIEYCEQQ